MSDDTQSKIISIVKYIKNHPADVKFFQVNEDFSFIMDGKKLEESELPFDAKKYFTREHFYIQVNPEEKEVMFYAYDVENYATKDFSNQEEGKLDWWKVASGIFKFLSYNLSSLSNSTSPYQDMQEKHESKSKEKPGLTRAYDHSNGYYNNYSPTSTSATYDSSVYKEKEAFSDKLRTILQANQSSLAIEYIETEMTKFINNKRIETIDYIYKWVGIEKMSAPVMVAMLNSTKEIASKLKDRKEFFDKVKTYLDKVKPNSSEKLLKSVNSEVPLTAPN